MSGLGMIVVLVLFGAACLLIVAGLATDYWLWIATGIVGAGVVAMIVAADGRRP